MFGKYRTKLAGLGFKETRETGALALPSERQPAFLELPRLQSFILQTDDDEKRDRAREVLGDDFYLTNDFPWAAIPPVGPGDRTPEEDARMRLPQWLPESGISAARSDGNVGERVIVAVLDTGIDADHREFADRTVEFVWVPPNPMADPRHVRGFDTDNHGTHVAGIIGGRSGGIAPGAELVSAAVIESETTRTSLDRIMRGLDWILKYITMSDNHKKPVVINMSLGFRTDDLAQDEAKGAIALVEGLIRQTRAYGALVLAAVGNDGPGTVCAPACLPGVVSVGAVDWRHEPADFSGGGVARPPCEAATHPAAVGYGVEVLSGIERDVPGSSWYGSKSGTSMATPYVAGIAALVAARTGRSGDLLWRHLVETALPLGGDRDRVGVGLVRYNVV
jgi:subtilisin family serine protease